MFRLFFFFFAAMTFLAESAMATPLSQIGTYCGTFPSQCARGTVAMLAAKGTTDNYEYIVEVDPTTGAIPTSGTITFNSEGTPGSTAPTKALQIGGTDGTNLRVISTDTTGKINVNNISGTVSLPTGAATAVKQPALGTAGSASTDVITIQGIASMTALSISGSVTQSGNWSVRLQDGSGSAVNKGQTTMSGSLPVTIASDQTPAIGRAYADSARNVYSTTNVTTGAWVQLIASTANVINGIELFDSSGQTLELGTGAAASETRVLIITPGGLDAFVPLRIAAGTRVSVRAVSGTASTGELDLTGMQ